MQTSASRFSLAAADRWEMKDSTNSRLAPLSVCGAAEVRRVGFHEIRIEVVLADQKAELIAEPGLAVAIPLEECPVRWRGNGGSSGALENAPNSSTEQRPIP